MLIYPVAKSMTQTILSLRRVYVSRGAAPVLHNINLDLQSGEHLAILGPNGCGKSTLLKLITGELYPLAQPPGGDRGESSVRIFGRDRWDLTDLRRRLGVVSADLPGRSTLQTSGFDAVLTGFFSASTLWPNLAVSDPMRARAEDLLHEVGAEHLRDKLFGAMSAGEQRRILIARALAGSRAAAAQTPTAVISTEPRAQPRGSGETPVFAPAQTPEMLLLDEPSNALDLAAQQDLRNLLRRLTASGTTLLLITHHTSDIIPEIDRVLLMRDGRIFADGPKRDLLTAPNLSTLFRTPIELTERDGFFHAW